MRIGIDVTWLGDNPAGVGTFAGEVIKELEGNKDLELVLFKARGLFLLKHINFYRTIKKAKLDVYWQLGGWLPIFMPRGVKAVQTVHDLIAYSNPEWFLQTGLSRFWSTRVRVPYAMHRADVIHAISEWTAKETKARFAVGNKVIVAYQGAEVPREVNRESMPNNLVNAPYMIAVGTIEPRKNIKATIDIFRLLAEKHNDIKLVIIGKIGWKSESSMREIDDLKNEFSDRVQYLGYVDDAKKFALIANARVLIMSSYKEGFGRPLVEAMRLGVLVIATDSSAMREVVGNAGVLINPNKPEAFLDKLERLIYNKEYSDTMRANGTRWVGQFDTKIMITQVLGLFNKE